MKRHQRYVSVLYAKKSQERCTSLDTFVFPDLARKKQLQANHELFILEKRQIYCENYHSTQTISQTFLYNQNGQNAYDKWIWQQRQTEHAVLKSLPVQTTMLLLMRFLLKWQT